MSELDPETYQRIKVQIEAMTPEERGKLVRELCAGVNGLATAIVQNADALWDAADGTTTRTFNRVADAITDSPKEADALQREYERRAASGCVQVCSEHDAACVEVPADLRCKNCPHGAKEDQRG